MEYLRKSDIILINEKTVERHGGNFVPPYNFLHEDNLDYLVEAVQAEMFGGPLYPEIHDKAGLYLFNIISNHIFQDGNKRTELEAALLFMRLNKRKLREQLVRVKVDNPSIPASGTSTNEILYNYVIEVASGQLTLAQCQRWFEHNTVVV